MSDATIDRINALTSNARSTWLGLFSVLVFAVVTLVRIEHIDFYGVDRGTQLPLVNITVPTYIFFYAAPILIFAIYGYLHLYLIRLWDALSVAPAWIGRTRLGDAVSPWLITDAALSLREILRRDGCAKRRETDYTSMILNFVISWLSGPFILGWIWCQSMPARDIWMTSLGGLMFAGSLAMGSVSLRLLLIRMRHKDRPQPNFARITANYGGTLLALCAFVLLLSWGRTMEPLFPRDIVNAKGEIIGQSHWIPLADIDLQDQRLTDRPTGWLPYSIARREALASWCKRDPVADCANLTDDEDHAFNDEWRIKRTAQINDLRKPTHLNHLKPDVVPTTTVVRHIPDDFPDMDWTTDLKLDIEVTVPNLPVLQRRLDLRDADLRGAFLAGTNLTAATLSGLNARNADLERVQLTYADLSKSDLSGAGLSHANLRGAQMQGAILWEAQMQGANLSLSLLTGRPDRPTIDNDTDLSASTNDGGALRSVDLTPARFNHETDWRRVFLDASVRVSPDFRRTMEFPCQWIWAETANAGKPLPDDMFFAMWRGWLISLRGTDRNWTDIAPHEWHDVAPIAPPDWCRFDPDAPRFTRGR